MQIRRPNPEPRDNGDYATYVDGIAYGNPKATVYLSADEQLTLAEITLDDARRLAKAAAQIERELTAAHARMTAPHGGNHFYQGTCQLCGKPEADELHAAPAPAPDKDTCPASREFPREGTVWCTREPGHPGRHAAGPLDWTGDTSVTVTGEDAGEVSS